MNTSLIGTGTVIRPAGKHVCMCPMFHPRLSPATGRINEQNRDFEDRKGQPKRRISFKMFAACMGDLHHPRNQQ